MVLVLSFNSGAIDVTGNFSEWTLNTNDLSPNSSSNTNVAIGGTDSNAPIYLNSDGTSKFGNTSVTGTLGVTNATTLSSTLAVTDATTLSSTLAVTGNTTLSGTLDVTNNTTLSADLDVTGSATVGGTLDVTGLATAQTPADNNESTQLATTEWIKMSNIQDVDDALSPVDGQVLVYDGTEWEAGEQVPNALRFKGTCLVL